MNIKDLWKEFLIESIKDDGSTVSLCGLCGNSGELDTTNSAIWNSKKVGVKRFCICPNGRFLKQDLD